MFILPDVVSASISCVQFMSCTFCNTILHWINLNIEHDIVLQIILWFFMTYHIYIECIHIYSYILVCEKYIFWHIFPFFSAYQDAYVNVN